MTTQSDVAEEATAEATGTGTPGEGSHAQARRTHAPAREGQPNTDSDERGPYEWPDWVLDLGEWAAKTPVLRKAPTPLGDVWHGVQAIAGAQEGALPRWSLRVLGSVGYAVSAVLYGVAFLAILPTGGGALLPLGDLWARIDTAARRRTRPWSHLTYLAGAVAWTVAGCCYGLAYAAQWPLLILLLGCCGLVPLISYLT